MDPANIEGRGKGRGRKGVVEGVGEEGKEGMIYTPRGQGSTEKENHNIQLSIYSCMYLQMHACTHACA